MNKPTPQANPLARFPVTAEQIAQVMQVFYTRIRQHPELGLIFTAHIGSSEDEWDAHIVKIGDFWRNAILREKSYSGNPMRIHVERTEIQPEHFRLWLDLFHEVLAAELPERTAASWGALAERIGEGFRTGVISMRQPKDAPPRLF